MRDSQNNQNIHNNNSQNTASGQDKNDLELKFRCSCGWEGGYDDLGYDPFVRENVCPECNNHELTEI